MIIEDKNVMHRALSEMNMIEQVTEAGPLPPEAAYIAFSPSHPKSAEYAQTLSDGIKEWKASGKYQEILKKYNVLE